MIFWLSIRKKYDDVKMRHDEITFLCEEVCRQAVRLKNSNTFGYV